MIQEKDGFKHWPKFDSQCKKQLDPWSDEVKKCMATSRTGIIDDGFYLGSGTNVRSISSVLLLSLFIIRFLMILIRSSL